MLTKFRLFLILSLLSLASAGCTSMGKMDSDAAPPANDHTYFVVGVEPSNARVMIFKGDVSNGSFIQNPLAAASFYGSAEDGFVLGETHSGNTLAITQVQIVSGENSILGASFTPGPLAKTLVFNTPAGKIVYLTSMRFVFDERSGVHAQLIPSNRNDIEGARAFLKKHYPQLADDLEQGQYEFLPVVGGGY